MWDFVKNILSNLVASGLWLISIPIALAVWAAFREYDPFQVVLIFLGAAAGAVVVANQGRQLMPKRKRWRTDKDMERSLSDWLRDAGYGVTYPAITAGELALNATSFIFVATLNDRPVTVVRFKETPGVRMQCLVRPDAAHAEVIAAMDTHHVSSLHEELGLELARFGLGFDLQDLLGNGIIIDYPLVLTDSVTQFQFVERVGFVARAILLVQLVVTRNVRAAQLDAATDPTPVPQSTLGTSASSPPPVSWRVAERPARHIEVY